MSEVAHLLPRRFPFTKLWTLASVPALYATPARELPLGNPSLGDLEGHDIQPIAALTGAFPVGCVQNRIPGSKQFTICSRTPPYSIPWCMGAIISELIRLQARLNEFAQIS